MFNVFEIVRNNQETYYNFSTGRPYAVWPSVMLKFFFSCLLSLFFTNMSAGFAEATVTVYSILIGFSFNVLFYLLSSNKLKIIPNEVFLENKVKINKLNKLANELFFNVSYFNFISVIVLVLALGFFSIRCSHS